MKKGYYRDHHNNIVIVYKNMAEYWSRYMEYWAGPYPVKSFYKPHQWVFLGKL